MLLSKLGRGFKRAYTTCLVPQRLASGSAVDLAFTTYGNNQHDDSKSPVVILHGLLASQNSWADVSEAISKTTGHGVITLDARNHGVSPHTSEHTYKSMVHDTIKMIRRLDLPKVILLGHSMGGKTAMAVSLLYPEEISKLILVDISPMSVPDLLHHLYPKLFGLLASLDFKGITFVEEAQRYIEEKMHAVNITQRNVIHFILKNVGVKPDMTVGWTCNMNALNEFIRVLLDFPYTPVSSRTYKGPTLFLGSEQSGFIPTKDHSGIKRYFPQARMQYIPNVGHNIHEEDPLTFLRLTTEFILKHTCNNASLRKSGFGNKRSK